MSDLQIEQEDEVIGTTVQQQNAVQSESIKLEAKESISDTVEIDLVEREDDGVGLQTIHIPEAKAGMSLLVAAFQSTELEQGGQSKKIPPSDDSPDLLVSVANPEKRAGRNRMGVSSSYMTYEVHTLTTLPEFGFAERSVRRRFSDFDILHQVLRRQFAGCFIPALPEKNYLESRRMGDEFIKIRSADLNKYIRQIAIHPEIRRSPEFVKFLSVETELSISFEWSQLVANSQQSGSQQQQLGGSKLFGVKETASSFTFKPQLSDAEIKWRDTRNELTERQKAYATASKSAETIIKSMDEMGTELEEFGEICVRFARFEEEQGEQHGQYTLAGRYSTKRAADYQQMGYGTLKMSPMYRRQALLTASKLIQLHDELAFIPEVFNGLNYREQVYAHSESLKQEIQAREAKTVAATVSVKTVQQQKELEILKQQAETSELQYSRILERNENEMVRFEQMSEREHENMLLGYIELQMQFNEQLQKSWNALAQSFQENYKLTGPESTS